MSFLSNFNIFKQIKDFYRGTLWFAKGYRNYTKDGYMKAASSFDISDTDVDLTGRCALVTGANSGIGRSITESLAKKGACLHMVCRDRERGEAARQEIIRNTSSNSILLHVLDMGRPRDVYEFGSKFGHRLDILVNNAGCMLHDRIINEDGVEKNFATNTLGPYILTEALLKKLEDHSGRVVIVSSGGMLTQPLTTDFNLENMRRFDGTVAYALNKRQQVVLMQVLARENPGIFFASMHPGWVDTPSVQASMPSFYQRMKTKLRTPEEGADTAIWLSASSAAKKYQSGMFFQDRAPVPDHLPLAGTKYSEEEAQNFVEELRALAKHFQKEA